LREGWKKLTEAALRVWTAACSTDTGGDEPIA
jgi:hypothetical protein